MTSTERSRRHREKVRASTQAGAAHADPEIMKQFAALKRDYASLKDENAKLRVELENRKPDSEFTDEINTRLTNEINRRLNEEMPRWRQALANAEAISKHHEGYIEHWMYPKILSRFHEDFIKTLRCIDPDYKGAEKDKQIFNVLKELEPILRKKANKPIPPAFPATAAELDAWSVAEVDAWRESD